MKDDFKPKKRSSYLKMFSDIKELCTAIFEGEKGICQECPFHVLYCDHCGCYFVHTGGIRPCEWNSDDLGHLV